jgi:hypothetical protein
MKETLLTYLMNSFRKKEDIFSSTEIVYFSELLHQKASIKEETLRKREV